MNTGSTSRRVALSVSRDSLKWQERELARRVCCGRLADAALAGTATADQQPFFGTSFLYENFDGKAYYGLMSSISTAGIEQISLLC